MRFTVPRIALLLMLLPVFGAGAQTVQRLWEGDAPGAHRTAPDDIPTLTVYLPDAAKATGAAMVVCPGGGYTSANPLGGDAAPYALWLNTHGVAAFVLKYRVSTHGYYYPAMMQDAARALRTVRANAAGWKVDPHRVGIMGSSAGGHLAATLMTQHDAGDATAADLVERESSRPDLGVLCYPVITMRRVTAGGSRAHLLGDNPSPELIELLSSEAHVTAETPPCFLWATGEDKSVSLDHGLSFAAALAQAGVPFDFHIYQRGNHGMGLGDSTPPFLHAHPWTHDLLFWLKEQHYAVD